MVIFIALSFLTCHLVFYYKQGLSFFSISLFTYLLYQYGLMDSHVTLWVIPYYYNYFDAKIGLDLVNGNPFKLASVSF